MPISKKIGHSPQRVLGMRGGHAAQRPTSAEEMYPSRVPLGKSTLSNDYMKAHFGPKTVKGRRVSMGESERGGGKITETGHTHTGSARTGIRRISGSSKRK